MTHPTPVAVLNWKNARSSLDTCSCPTPHDRQGVLPASDAGARLMPRINHSDHSQWLPPGPQHVIYPTELARLQCYRQRKAACRLSTLRTQAAAAAPHSFPSYPPLPAPPYMHTHIRAPAPCSSWSPRVTMSYSRCSKTLDIETQDTAVPRARIAPTPSAPLHIAAPARVPTHPFLTSS